MMNVPCRRRAIWAAQSAAQAALLEVSNGKIETRVNANEEREGARQALQVDGDRGRNHHEEVQARADETGRSKTGTDSRVAPKDQSTATKEVNEWACPKCGKEFHRGRHFHIRFCKG